MGAIWHNVHRLRRDSNEFIVEHAAVELVDMNRTPLKFLAHHNDVAIIILDCIITAWKFLGNSNKFIATMF